MNFGFLLAAAQSVLSVIEQDHKSVIRREDFQRGLLRLFSVNADTFEKLYLALCRSGILAPVDQWSFQLSKPECLKRVVRIYMKATLNPDKMVFFSLKQEVANDLVRIAEIFKSSGKPHGGPQAKQLCLMQVDLVQQAQASGIKVDSMTFVHASQLDVPIQKTQEADGVKLVVDAEEWGGLANFLKVHHQLKELMALASS